MELSGTTLLLTALTVGGAVTLAVIASMLLARSAEERDIGSRVRIVLMPSAKLAVEPRVASRAAALVQPFRQLGERLRGAAVVSEKDIADFQRQLVAAGFNPRVAVPTFIGIKAVLLVGLPMLGLLYAVLSGFDFQLMAVAVFAGIAAAVLGPNMVLGVLRGPFEARLRRGLPDALDLLVVATEAGLGLESALERVVREMRQTNAAVALEFTILVQELRLLSDRREALERFAQRSEIDGFRRLAVTLSQTLRYGTPLSQALRTLASEMREQRMLRIEEKAIRLPALLVIPLIIFILPSVFIALIGPSVLQFSASMGNPGP
jgi:tight adherence protein C